jgi:hypothetical protein
MTDQSATWIRLRSALPKASILAAALPTDYADDGAQVFPDLDISETAVPQIPEQNARDRGNRK